MESAVRQLFEYRPAWKLLFHSLFQTSWIIGIILETLGHLAPTCVSQIARAAQIAGEAWNGVTSAGVTAESIVGVDP
jgi:hypothetical protein